ncbi:MAG: CinA family nicotinamide mononucleotide deamidase-related protein [Proteobacteria bacterium]|nr:CinA family nicotinamide mononucleotide deamidase-related protein [Pseudomonadota bacterium]MBU1546812.1 CinA family nicotinamide mononucleotide deamidase-related protein [Pseudomonadota bacterium]MBU2619598.1 CinA family nicotinamide mononucleotide deamidase-related protein [Pseudomonadota bacterium]
MFGEIIAIGDELTSGRVLNTTSYFAASHLFAAGHEILAMTTIGDEPELIGRTLQRALQRADFVIVTGGLGPTTDDLTNAAVSSALARPATLYPEILKKIQAHGKDLPAGQRVSLEKLAWLPAGAHALHTEAQTAGYFLVQDGKPIFFLPGVPQEMEDLLLETVITRLAVWEGEEVRQVRQKVYKVVGLAESEINRRLAHLEGRDPRVRIGYYPVFPEVHVSLTVTGATGREAETAMQKYDGKMSESLGDCFYGSGADTLESVVGRLLGDRGQTLAVAESCTGGLIGHTLTKIAGSSGYFLGGVVAYSDALKERLLGVNREILLRSGAVSADCARAMAEGMRRVTASDHALSVTGIAGPGGGSEDKPVGTVYFGLAGPEKTQTFLFRFFGERGQVQAQASQTALDLLRRHLLGLNSLVLIMDAGQSKKNRQ